MSTLKSNVPVETNQDTTRCITVAGLPLKIAMPTGLLFAASHRLVSPFETRETLACLLNEIKIFADGND